MAKNVSNKTIDNVTIRFAGDSGDGMQLSGGRFTQTSAVVGNDLAHFLISRRNSRTSWFFGRC